MYQNKWTLSDAFVYGFMVAVILCLLVFGLTADYSQPDISYQGITAQPDDVATRIKEELELLNPGYSISVEITTNKER